MKINNQAIVGCIGMIAIAFATIYTNTPNCLWGTLLLILLVERIEN